MKTCISMLLCAFFVNAKAFAFSSEINWRHTITESKIEGKKFTLKMKAQAENEVCEALTMENVTNSYLRFMDRQAKIQSKTVSGTNFDLDYTLKDKNNNLPWRTTGHYTAKDMVTISETKPMVLSGLAASLKKLHTLIKINKEVGKMKILVDQTFEFEVPGYLPDATFKSLATKGAVDGFKENLDRTFDPIAQDLSLICQ